MLKFGVDRKHYSRHASRTTLPVNTGNLLHMDVTQKRCVMNKNTTFDHNTVYSPNYLQFDAVNFQFCLKILPTLLLSKPETEISRPHNSLTTGYILFSDFLIYTMISITIYFFLQFINKYSEIIVNRGSYSQIRA